MNKLKLVLDFFKKYLFWFLSVLTIVMVLTCWWLSTRSLATQFQEQQRAIQGKFSAVEAIASNSEHPTPELIKAIEDKHQNVKQRVLNDWKTLYDEQLAKNPWPDMLGAEFKNLKPGATINDRLCAKYQNMIKDYFPTLYKIVDLRRPDDASEKGGKNGKSAAPERAAGGLNPLTRIGMAMGGKKPIAAAAEEANMIGVVDWDEDDRQRIEEKFNWSSRPDSNEIRLAQEDIWVYETLLRVIREANEGATEQSQANVKRIEWLHIGADAVKDWSDADQSVFRTQDALVATRGTGPTEIKGGIGREGAAQDRLTNRYIDEKGVPLEVDAKGPYAEFKMMPISMKLEMDQRKISKLLAECVNRSMPIEVRRLRIRPGEGEIFDPATKTSSTAATNLSASRTSVIRSRVSERSAGGRTQRAALNTVETEMGPYDVPVEIQGIIYIYNPPDVNALGTGAAGDKPAEAAPGAATPPT
jgi:hypothetical protein